MARLLGFLFSVAAIGLLFYSHPRAVDIVAAYAWVTAALSVVIIPIFFFADSSRTFPKRDEAAKATSKPRLAWGFVRIVLIGGGLAFHGLVITAAFFLTLSSLFVVVMNTAAEARLSKP